MSKEMSMERITPEIRAEEAGELLRRLVQAPSVNPPGDTTAVVEVIGRYLDEAGIAWRSLEAAPGIASLVAQLPGSRQGKTVLLNGHIDVVPAGDGWSVEPYGAVEKDGRMYGRGTSDMKAGIAAMLLALVALKRSGADFPGEVVLMAAADEETGGRLGTNYLLEQGFGRDASFAIVGEPTDLRIDLGNRGVAWIEITIKGRAGHPGRPVTGVNAVHYAGRLIQAIAEMQFDLRNDLFEVSAPSVTVTMVNGGVKANVIPDTCKLNARQEDVAGGDRRAGDAPDRRSQLPASLSRG